MSARFAAELRVDAATLRAMADALDRRAAEQDQLARAAEARRSAANRRYADDRPSFGGLAYTGSAHAPTASFR